jgi:hypothetical protein
VGETDGRLVGVVVEVGVGETDGRLVVVVVAVGVGVLTAIGLVAIGLVAVLAAGSGGATVPSGGVKTAGSAGTE